MKKILNVLFVLSAIIVLTKTELVAKEILFDVDINKYAYYNDSVLVEISYSFDQSSLKYVKIGDIYLGKLNISTEISNNTQKLYDEKFYLDFNSETENPDNNLIVGIRQYFLPVGQYNLKIGISDDNDSTNKAENLSVLFVGGFPKNKLSVSDMIIAYNIEDEETLSQNWSKMFFRNGLYVVPNPKKEIVGDEPLLNVYYEVYNAKLIQLDSIITKVNIYNAYRSQVLTKTIKEQTDANNFRNFAVLSLDTLPSGVYYAELSVKGYKDDFIDSSATYKKFYVLNPIKRPELKTYFSEDELYAKSEFAALPDNEVEIEFDKAKVLASNSEIDVYKRLTEMTAKRHFLYSFWAKRNTDTISTYNSYRETFKENVRYANDHYQERYGRDNGWKSDRGRILIKYGKPTQLEVFQAEDGKNPYEKWTYDSMQGGAVFVFVDVRNSHVFKLVHSTASNEILNENWYNQYVVRNSTQDNKNKTNINSILK